MKKKTTKLFGIFDKRPLIWLHYVLLGGALSPLYYLGNYLFSTFSESNLIMFLWFTITIGIVDQLIHWGIGVD